jgi:O-antigen biosynthesis protein
MAGHPFRAAIAGLRDQVQMSRPVSIIIPAFNELEYCRQCVDSITLNTDPASYRLVLVDNGSTDGVGAYFDTIDGAVVVHAGQNLGFAGGVNLGLKHAEGDVLLLNSDTVVPREWLPRLQAALHADDRAGIVGPMSNHVSGAQLIPSLDLTSMDEVNAFSDKLFQEKGTSFVRTKRLVGFCMLIRERVIESVGMFDESFGLGNFEDDDYCLRAIDAGYELRIASGCFVFHYGSRTFTGMGIAGDRWNELLAGNGARFQEKWGRALGHDENAGELNAKAREALDQGDRKTALTLLMEAVAADPANGRHYNDLGAVLWDMGERKRAIALFERALALNPEDGDAHENLTAAKEIAK